MKGFGIICAMILSCLTQVGFAATTYNQTVNGIQWTYTVSNGKASVGGGTSSSTAVPTSTTGIITIPSELGGYPVTSIGSYAFSACWRLTSVSIPDSVTRIGNYAFSGCGDLTSVSIPDSATSIGEHAFYNCSRLTSVTIGDSVTSIGDSAFYGCRYLTSVSIPDSVTSIGGHAFSGTAFYNALPDGFAIFGRVLYAVKGACPSVVAIPDRVTSIGDSVFYYCSGLTSVMIPDSVTSIGEDAFYGCSGLTNLVIPDSVTSIGDSAFYGCSGLTSVTIPNKVTSIGDSAFYGCSGLTSVTIPDSVTSIGDSAFYGCSGLTNVTIPDSVTSIGNSAFSGCSGLTSVTIPNRVESIGYYAFYGCSGLTNLTIPQCVCSSRLSTIFPSAYSNLTSVTIHDRVTSIGSETFSGCSGLTSVMIPNRVTSIGDSAFSGCSGLTSVTIPSSISSIGSAAFSGCTSIVEATVPGWKCDIPFDHVTNLIISAGTKTIAANAFSGCSGLVSVTIPDSVTSIGDSAFSGCSGLTSVTIPSSISSIGSAAFSGCTSIVEATVPGWKCDIPFDHVTNLIISAGTKTIAANAFSGCSGLVSVTIPDSVTIIGDSAFSGCSGLTSVTIPNSVTNIGASVFSGCSGLGEITMPFVGSRRGNTGGVDALFGYIFGASSYAGGTSTKQYYSASSYSTYCIPSVLRRVIITDESSFGYGAFSYCSGPTNITFGGNLTSIGPAAFRGCSGLTSMTIPGSVASIGNQAFDGCSKLANVHIDDVASWCKICFGNYYSNPLVYANKFYMNGGLVTNLEIPSSVTSIGDFAFCKCSGLTSVTIPNTVTRIGDYAFRNCGGLTSITIPNSVTHIGNDAFYSCSKLMSVEIGGSVISIGESAFDNCTKLANVTISDSVTSIGSYAFRWCSGLTNITIGGHVISIGSSAFASCSKLSSVTIPDSVTSIGSSAFSYCSGLTNITIGSGVTSIGMRAFIGCSGLASVTIPCGVTSIGGAAFRGCSGLTSFIVDEDNENYKSVSGLLLTKDGQTLIAGVKGEVTIPNSVASVGSDAFSGCSGLTSVTIPDSVTSIGSDAFSGCSGLTNVLFEGNAPTMGNSVFSGVTSGCCVSVRQDSTGWGVDIPGTWQGVAIAYAPFDVMLDANGGDCAVTMVSVEVGAPIGELPTPTRWGYAFKGWWTEQNGGEEVAPETIPDGDLTLYAHWERHVVAAPKISLVDGSVYGDLCTVMITCATDGATIYYSAEGVTPEISDSYIYNAPFMVENMTVVKAVAVLEGVESDCATVRIIKKTLNAVLDAPDSVTIASDPAAPWQPVVDESAKMGGGSARSGAIGNRTNTWLSATVEGAGTMIFWCKVSCEHDEDNMFTWDRLMIYTNDVEIAEWRMDGETDWTERTLAFGGGTNTVKWVYYKDRTGAGGEDCAWVDAVAWSPAGAADPIPAVAVDADAATVNATVDEVGFADAAVKEVIGGSAEEYNAFKTWADGVKGATGDALAGEAAVVANGHAAAAYLLGAERLFENEPTVEIGELSIAESEGAGTTAMTVAVTVKDGESAVAVSAAKVAAMFEATGDLGDWTGAAKLIPTVTPSGTDASGKMTFVVTLGDGTASKAFLRIRK